MIRTPWQPKTASVVHLLVVATSLMAIETATTNTDDGAGAGLSQYVMLVLGISILVIGLIVAAVAVLDRIRRLKTNYEFLLRRIVLGPTVKSGPEFFLHLVVFLTFVTLAAFQLMGHLSETSSLFLFSVPYAAGIIVSGLATGAVGGLLAGEFGTIVGYLISPIPPTNILMLMGGAMLGGFLSGLIAALPRKANSVNDRLAASIGLIALYGTLFLVVQEMGPLSTTDLFIWLLSLPAVILGAFVLGIVAEYFRRILARLTRGIWRGSDEFTDEDYEPESTPPDLGIEATQSREFAGDKMRYKIDVVNKTGRVTKDLTVAIVSYPEESLAIVTEPIRTIFRVDPDEVTTIDYDFYPIQDHVVGDILANVSYVDSSDIVRSLEAEPFAVRVLCELLTPEAITPEDFDVRLKISNLEQGEQTFLVLDWTPEEMHQKALLIMESSNFHEVSSEVDQVGEYTEIKVAGWAKGKQTGKHLALGIEATGKSGFKGATCLIRIHGENKDMIEPAIDEISEKLNAWLCLDCGREPPVGLIDLLKAGKGVLCPFCGAAVVGQERQ